MKIKTQADIPADWKTLTVRKKTAVRIRPALKIEEFAVDWQDAKLISDPVLDLIVIQPNGKEYPCKKDIFFETYRPVPAFMDDTVIAGYAFDKPYIKSATTQLVEIPEGETVEIETLEGTLPAVTYPDYIAIGIQGELYANTKEFFDKNLEVVS